MSEKEYLIALSTFLPFGPVRTRLLLDFFGSAEKIWNANSSDLKSTGLNINIVDAFIIHRKKIDLYSYLDKLIKLEIGTLNITDSNYPENLKNIPDAPVTLYVKGQLKKSDNLAVAMVGSRITTNYGREVANKFAGEIAAFGITVVSGLAFGIDIESQKAAYRSGGRTLTVLASGLDYISPVTNRPFALEFIKENGALISEYPLGHLPRPYDFPLRDRLIAGLAKAVIVVESRKNSGTFYTVKAALDQGKTVFAVPGPINSKFSEGTNYLIQNGAKVLTDTKDILDELGIEFNYQSRSKNMSFTEDNLGSMLIKILSQGPVALDEIVRISGAGTGEISSRLTILELQGVVKNLGNSTYQII